MRLVKVSVVIPCYNAAPWISETLESVYAQEFDDFEVIVVDDGSTDNSSEIIRGFPSVNYIKKPNGGAGSARNLGIKSSCGEFIAFVDADDLWVPEKIRHQVEQLLSNGYRWGYSDANVIDGDSGRRLYRFSELNPQYSGDILEPLAFNDFIPSPTPIVRRNVFEEVGYFNESEKLRKREDWDMWLRISARYPVDLISKPLASYRVHITSSTGDESLLDTLRGQIAVIERAVSREERLSGLRNRVVSHLYTNTGRAFAGREDIKAAREMFSMSISSYPWNFSAYLFWAITFLGNRGLAWLIALRHWSRRYKLR
jgi:glycosyltransferase involved in cell wall biosynthesis